MKKNKIEKNNGIKGFMLLLAAILPLGAAVGLFIAYSHLRELWLEQCVITDAATQVQISSGKLVQAGTIAEKFGLVNGANIALIDFPAKRQQSKSMQLCSFTRATPKRLVCSISRELVNTMRLCRNGVNP